MSWTDRLGGIDGSLPGRLATHARDLSLPAAAAAARATRAASGVRTFPYDGRELPYVVHGYNQTWRNERAVELAIAFDWLARRPAGPVLEVGHVLGHYRSMPRDHTVVDLYEEAPGVLNTDAMTYRPETQFTSIVSISTLEHVGFDEEEQDDDKPRRLVDHLTSLLAPGGELMITYPINYNYQLDQHLLAGRLGFDRVDILRRATSSGAWQPASLTDIPQIRFGFPFRLANAVCVARRASPN